MAIGKIIGVSLVLILSVGIVIGSAPSAGAEDFWSNIVNSIEEWFRISPFSGMFENPSKEVTYIQLVFYPTNFSIEPTAPFDASSKGFELYNFAGGIIFNPANNEAVFRYDGSEMKLIGHLSDNISISDLHLASVSLKNTRLEIKSGNWTETTVNGSAEFIDFSGSAKLYFDRIELEGNVSRIVKK